MRTAETDRLRVVVVDEDLCWPPNNGKRIRTYNLLRRMAPNHDVTLIAYAYEDDDPAATDRLAADGLKIVRVRGPSRHKRGYRAGLGAFRSALAGAPYSVALYDTRTMRHSVRAAVRRLHPDLLHIELTTMGGAVPHFADVPMSLNAHNCESRIWARLANNTSNLLESILFKTQASLMEKFERRLIARCQRTCVVSEIDAEQLARICPGRSFDVVPNGVDLDEFGLDRTHGQPHSLIFTGALDWRPMQDAVVHLLDEILPEVRRFRPEAQAVIAGRRPPQWLQSFVEQREGASLLGDVPDIRVPLRNAAVAVVPIRAGSGSRLKILEAFALGRPVVSTSTGAEGLRVQHEKHLLVADSPTDFARSLLRLWDDDTLYFNLVENGRRLVEERHGWDAIAVRFEQSWRDAARSRAGDA